MAEVTGGRHKSMLDLHSGESFLSRLTHQLSEYDIDRLVVVTGYLHDEIQTAFGSYPNEIHFVHNEAYATDTNCRSMLLALANVDPGDTTIVLEGDVYVDHAAMRDVIAVASADVNSIFTFGTFEATQSGGIVSVDDAAKVDDFKIVGEYLPQYCGFKKTLGIMVFAKWSVPKIASQLQKRVSENIDCYYLQPWIDDADFLPLHATDLSKHLVFSANSLLELNRLNHLLKQRSLSSFDVRLCSVSDLKPIEGHIEDKVPQLAAQIEHDGVWTQPVVIEEEHMLILDGHHRYQVALGMGLKRIPVVALSYDDIELWSLRPECSVSREEVIARAISGDIYPKKTVKHDFKKVFPQVNTPLSELF